MKQKTLNIPLFFNYAQRSCIKICGGLAARLAETHFAVAKVGSPEVKRSAYFGACEKAAFGGRSSVFCPPGLMYLKLGEWSITAGSSHNFYTLLAVVFIYF
ncbi:MAG: hypothetical protein WBM43_12330 [Flavobacteriaceae bacterium]